MTTPTAQAGPVAGAWRADDERDMLAKSYRYLRTAMVGLLVCLATAVLWQTGEQGWHLLTSVSAYYYTPAQGIFVGALVGLGACMIALQGRGPFEDALLNLGGVCAAVVAVVPTSRGADHRAAVRLCAGTDGPLLSARAGAGRPDCPTVKALVEATRANVENNVSALVAAVGLAVLAAVLFAVRDGALRRGPGRRAALGWLGLSAAVFALVLWVRVKALDWMVDNAHFSAAAGLLGCIFLVALINAQASQLRDAGPEPVPEPGWVGWARDSVRQARDSVRLLFVDEHRNRYIWLARLMVVVVVACVVLWCTGFITLFWLELAVAGLFALFWTAQTLECDRPAFAGPPPGAGTAAARAAVGADAPVPATPRGHAGRAVRVE